MFYDERCVIEGEFGGVESFICVNHSGFGITTRLKDANGMTVELFSIADTVTARQQQRALQKEQNLKNLKKNQMIINDAFIDYNYLNGYSRSFSCGCIKHFDPTMEITTRTLPKQLRKEVKMQRSCWF